MGRLVDRFIAYQHARKGSALISKLVAEWRGARDLADQALRASTSMTFNLSEGSTRPPDSNDRIRYYRYAWGSAVELEAILDAAEDRALSPPSSIADARAFVSQVARILTAIVTRAEP